MTPSPDHDHDRDLEAEEELRLLDEPTETCARCGTPIIGEVPVRMWQEAEVEHVLVPITEMVMHWNCYVEAARNGEL